MDKVTADCLRGPPRDAGQRVSAPRSAQRRQNSQISPSFTAPSINVRVLRLLCLPADHNRLKAGAVLASRVFPATPVRGDRGLTPHSRVRRFSLPVPRPNPIPWVTLRDRLRWISSHRTGTRSQAQQFVTPCFFDPNLINLKRMFLGFPTPPKATGAPSPSNIEPSNSLTSPEGPSPKSYSCPSAKFPDSALLDPLHPTRGAGSPDRDGAGLDPLQLSSPRLADAVHYS